MVFNGYQSSSCRAPKVNAGQTNVPRPSYNQVDPNESDDDNNQNFQTNPGLDSNKEEFEG
jgi:hypothetical protein